jgi:Spy/CpxP family protein refolding chaperone
LPRGAFVQCAQSFVEALCRLTEPEANMEMPPQKQFLFPAILFVFLTVAYLPIAYGQTEAVRGSEPQDSSGAAGNTAPSSQQQMADVLRALGEMRQELHDSRQQVDELRKEVLELREEVAGGGKGSASADALKADVEQLREDQAVAQSQVKTLQQSKVETQSKYPVSVTGMMLFNSFVVDGSVDDSVLPLIALPRTANYDHHSLGASLRQTEIGLHATGPLIWNAHTSANVTADFFNEPGYTSAAAAPKYYLHLHSADIALNWANTQVTAGLETPLVSLLSPTSFASVSEPELAWSGNLWTWLPQLTVEQQVRLQGSSRAVFGFGLLDPTTDDTTGEQAYGIQRRSLQPGYEARTSWQWGDSQDPYEVGVNGYFTRQLYFGEDALSFWAGTADWRVPLSHAATLSGEFYHGSGIGDLGGGAFKNIVTGYKGNYGRPLDSTGGWAQFKARFNPITEANIFFGEDSADSAELRYGTPIVNDSPYLYLLRNRGAGGNLIFRPKSYLLFSGEYRNLRSWYIYGPAQTAGNITLTMGYLF